ncbi:hypothetical protein EVAR_56530_1 [Eumeta japonica]|uniref:Uncharacterized protein n=1 Tax=Eumeta variegata TaxID=151549 RepID=A0A4C1YUW6_EUMVA|nr:hypothetical protein EVAR_56530_1 [Eumeta japonica]
MALTVDFLVREVPRSTFERESPRLAAAGIRICGDAPSRVVDLCELIVFSHEISETLRNESFLSTHRLQQRPLSTEKREAADAGAGVLLFRGGRYAIANTYRAGHYDKPRILLAKYNFICGRVSSRWREALIYRGNNLERGHRALHRPPASRRCAGPVDPFSACGMVRGGIDVKAAESRGLRFADERGSVSGSAPARTLLSRRGCLSPAARRQPP